MTMTKTRKRAAAVMPPVNPKEAEKVLSIYAESDAKINQLEAQIDEAFTKIREKYADDLQELKDKRSNSFLKMQMYAESNPDLFGKKKSFEMSHGAIGFRTGTPKLKTKKGFTWAAVLNLLKQKGKDAFIRTTEAPAKDLILANRENDETKVLMTEVGVQVVQDETFFIELKKEEVE